MESKSWTILKSHPYLDFLRNNDFTYKEALTVKKSHKIRVLYRDYNTTFSLNLPFGHLFYVIRFLSSSAYSNVLKSSKGLWYKVYLLYASDCCMPSVNKFGVNYGCSSQTGSPAALYLPIAAGELFEGQGTIHENHWCKLKANSWNWAFVEFWNIIYYEKNKDFRISKSVVMTKRLVLREGVRITL